MKLNNIYFLSSYDLKAGKKCTVRARTRAGGGAPPRGLATPRRKDGLCSFCLAIGQEAPCGPSDRFRVMQSDEDTKTAQDGVDQARRGRVIHRDLEKRPVERDSGFPVGGKILERPKTALRAAQGLLDGSKAGSRP